MDECIENKFVQLKINEHLAEQENIEPLTIKQLAYFNFLVAIFNMPKMLLVTDNYLRYIELDEIERMIENADMWLFICCFPKSEFTQKINADHQCIVEFTNKEFRPVDADTFRKILNKPKRKHHDTTVEFDEDF
jgi:hypothetical protein